MKMAFVGNISLMTMVSLWLSKYGSWRLTEIFMTKGCKLWFRDRENVYNVVGKMWKNKC
jgi:hypothetical protein